MTAEKYLTYRGDVKAAVGIGGTLAFVTVHPEDRATGLYRLDAETLALEVDPLPRGGRALVADDQALWIAGGDDQVYEASATGSRPKPRGGPLAAPTALAPLADGRL